MKCKDCNREFVEGESQIYLGDNKDPICHVCFERIQMKKANEFFGPIFGENPFKIDE